MTLDCNAQHFSAVSKWFTSGFKKIKRSLKKEKKRERNDVALTEDVRGDCLAYVAYCSLELATDYFQVYQQCKK